jgi:hypothetical protein
LDPVVNPVQTALGCPLRTAGAKITLRNRARVIEQSWED